MKSRLLLFCFLIGCAGPESQSEVIYYSSLSGLPSLEGKPVYLESPFVTAGDRLYMVGHQNGTFPDLGWHIQGEMGGIWDHPIKLMDGFTAEVSIKGTNDTFCINQADQFVNYPVGNKHHFVWEEQEMTIERFQFVPDGMEGAIVEFRFINHSTEPKELTFRFTGMTDLRPTWLGEKTNMIDAEDEIRFDNGFSAFIGKDKNNPWFTMFGSMESPDGKNETPTCTLAPRKGLGKDATLSYTIKLDPNGSERTLPMFIAGSYQSEKALFSTYESLKLNGAALLASKIERFRKIGLTSKITIPDKGIEQMFEWLKYNTDWLIRNVPEQGVGLSAGMPDYPWWFGCDNTYALQGVLATGDHQIVRNTILLLNKISKQVNQNGRIIHEVSTNGSVYNPGNVNETAQFITLLRNYYRWTGDKELIAQLFPDVRKAVVWLLEEMDPDRNGYPNGSGMMEIHGLDTEMIDVVAYTQQAMASAAELALALGEPSIATNYQKGADELKRKINVEWWQPMEHSYGDFRGTVAEALPVLEAALVRADTLGKPWAVAELKETKRKLAQYPKGVQQPHVIYHNWVVNTPMETGVADPQKAKEAFRTARKYENPFGVFVTGIDRTSEPDSVVMKSRKKIFSYTGAVMTLPTGLQALALAKYGYPDEALIYLTKLQNSFSYALPGSMYEVSPDFGMMTQAWNIYGVAVTIEQYFLGLQPNAADKTVTIAPNLPSAWNEVSIDNVLVGNNSISLSINRKDGATEYRLHQTNKDWKIVIPIGKSKKVTVNEKEVEAKVIATGRLELTGEDLVIRF